MKRTLFIIALAAFAQLCMAQSAQEKLFNKYSKAENAETMNIDKAMLSMAMAIAGDKVERMEFLKNLDCINMIKIEKATAKTVKKVKKDIKKFKDKAYKEVASITEGNKLMRVLTSSDNDILKGLLLMIASDDDVCMFVNLKGNLPKEVFEKLISNGNLLDKGLNDIFK